MVVAVGVPVTGTGQKSTPVAAPQSPLVQGVPRKTLEVASKFLPVTVSGEPPMVIDGSESAVMTGGGFETTLNWPATVPVPLVGSMTSRSYGPPGRIPAQSVGTVPEVTPKPVPLQ